MESREDYGTIASFLVGAARDAVGHRVTEGSAILDFGCGRGGLVHALRAMGFEARGCDFAASLGGDDTLQVIQVEDYRLPYEDATFDLVVSTSVFEHAQNTETCMREIHRVLRPGGVAVHAFPGKWYLPKEPHIYVPLVNWFWPAHQRPWLALWAIVGVRNEYQEGLSWREVMRRNVVYVREGLSYPTTRTYDQISERVFDDHAWPMRYAIDHGPGGAAALARKLPFKAVSGWVLREFRVGLLVQHKRS